MCAPALTLFILMLFPKMVCGTAANQMIQPNTIPAGSGPVKLHDIKDVIPLSSPFPVWYWFAAILALVATIALIVLLLRKKKRNRQIPLQPHERASKSLDAAQILMTPEQSRAFAIQVADILRTYIEERFHIFQPNLTTREFLYQLTRHQSDNEMLMAHNQLLHDWLNHCDMVKFAKYTLNQAEMEQLAAQVRRFVAATTKKDSIKAGGKKR